MANQLPGTWPGEWTDSGNDAPGIGSVDLDGVPEAPEVDDDGLLSVPLAAGEEITIWMAGNSNSQSGSIGNDTGTTYDTRAALQADVDLQAVTLSVYTAGRDAFGQWQSELGEELDLGDLAAGELLDERTESTTAASNTHEDGGGRSGKVRLELTPAEAGTLQIAPVWYSAAADVPEAIEWPSEDDGGGGVAPIPEDELAAELAPRVAAYIGKTGNAAIVERITGQLPIVIQFVNGYTRGHGFTEGKPNAALRACIISAASRLASNPQQIRQYSIGDYSQTSALLTGFTLMERRTLNNYRRVTA